MLLIWTFIGYRVLQQDGGPELLDRFAAHLRGAILWIFQGTWDAWETLGGKRV